MNFWNTYTLPSDLNVGVLVKVPQYRDLTKFNIWRRITLLLHVNQVFEPIMLNTLSYFLSSEKNSELLVDIIRQIIILYVN